MASSGRIILISSHVAAGAVGNRIMGFTLERLGMETVDIPTVLLPHHPGFGLGRPILASPADFAALLAGVATRFSERPPLAVATGYFGRAEHVAETANFIAGLKDRFPGLVYLCDPVMGDSDRLYVPEPVAEAIRDHLLPIADIATPNVFEFGWLTGTKPEPDPTALVADARRLGPAEVIVTSAPALMRGRMAAVLVKPNETILAEHPVVANPAKGAGDLFSALYLGRKILGASSEEALAFAAAGTADLFVVTEQLGRDELAFAEGQDVMLRPNLGRIALRRIAEAKGPISLT
ncbi:PfkB family carbohydrate kinase [Afifella sp. JA880]|uniref:PfkB family carbohydrate kinase n=1 Tax=Afifella sp. JA880 TaxID=2975280 RepID=UPI0021BACEC6|nr:PfkB family carbohydrate kinase [Afifella sp. JA880]MCT8268433.1 PfkB family carbohydrate kinase [Afifella sp. JA880]